jgi:hypothetical protein
MEITAQGFKKMEDLLPVQRGNVRHGNLKFLNAIPRAAENGRMFLMFFLLALIHDLLL